MLLLFFSQLHNALLPLVRTEFYSWNSVLIAETYFSEQDSAVRLDLAADLDDLFHDLLLVVSLSLNCHLLSHEIDLGVDNSINLFDPILHLKRAVGAVEIFQHINFLHGMYFLSINRGTRLF